MDQPPGTGEGSSGGAPYGRLFAGLHLAGLASLLAGVAVSFVVREAWPLWLVFSGGFVLWVQANMLGRSDPDLDGGPHSRGRLTNYQYAWYHLVLGREVRRAWRVLRG